MVLLLAFAATVFLSHCLKMNYAVKVICTKKSNITIKKSFYLLHTINKIDARRGGAREHKCEKKEKFF